MALDSTSKTLTFAGASNLNFVAECEARDIDLATKLDIFWDAIDAEFADMLRFDIFSGFFDVSGHGLAQILTLTKCQLYSAIAV